MQAQREVPPDMQCKDKFLLQCVIANPGMTAKDIIPEMVDFDSCLDVVFFVYGRIDFLKIWLWICVV